MLDGDYIGLDVGMARTGIARASLIAKLAEPLAVVPTDSLLEELKAIASGKTISGLVVGLPRSLDGNDTQQTKWVKDWAESAQKQINAPFYFQDEALTTKHAEKLEPNNLHSDSVAAAIILQDFLDGQEK